MQIRIDRTKWSGLDIECTNISTIDIENKPFSSGGFGEVYHCLKLNGQPVTQDMVIKVLTGNPRTISKGSDTIDKLQDKILSKAQELKLKGKSFLNEYPAMLGCPQFSFQGTINGKKMVGYAAYNLKTLGYEGFNDVLSTPSLLKEYRSLSLQEKLRISLQVVSTFELLLDFFYYIHADFKADAVFVNLNSKDCAIIDFDSGAVMQTPDDKPSTWGALQEWLAPEIFRQIDLGQSQRKQANQAIPVKVDRWSDMWSVAICIHFFIFTFHPYFFLSEITERSLKAYQTSGNAFPQISKKFGFLTTNQKSINVLNDYYIKAFDHLPPALKDKLTQTLLQGCLHPSNRTSYAQWKMVLQTSQEPPRINQFKADRYFVDDPNGVTIFWKVENAISVAINTEDVSRLTHKHLEIEGDTVLKLTASNAFGETYKQIKIKTSKEAPKIQFFGADIPNNHLSKPEEITFFWKVSGAYHLNISPGGNVTGKNSIKLPAPKRDTVYMLQAKSYFGIATEKKLEITVSKEAPIVAYFKASKPYVTNGETIHLYWASANAERVEITGIGTLPGSGSHPITPKQDMIFTLTAYTYFGRSVQVGPLKIEVDKNPPKVFLTATPLMSDKTKATLSWQTTGAEKVEITPGIGPVASSGTRTVLVSENAYTIQATSPYGYVTENSVLANSFFKKFDKRKLIKKPLFPENKPQFLNLRNNAKQ